MLRTCCLGPGSLGVTLKWGEVRERWGLLCTDEETEAPVRSASKMAWECI